MTTEFQHGPFTFLRGNFKFINNVRHYNWTMDYGTRLIKTRALLDGSTTGTVIDEFADARGDFIRAARDEHGPEALDLIDYETGDAVAHLSAVGDVGLTPGLIDDRSRYWLRSRDRLRSRDVTLTEFAAIAALHAAPKRHWITGLLPDDVLTENPDDWRAPTSWELRHAVGEGSFTGISGAKAAAIVGVTPQNFRKYTARDEAKGRQNISFAMWHLLLHKLDIKRIVSQP